MAKVYYRMTEKVFNIGVGKVLENRGYDKKYSFRLKSEKEEIPDLERLLIINPNQILLQGEGNIDLGGFGKGFLIDMLSYYFIHELGLKYFLINGGGDIYVTSNYESVVEVYLQSPVNEVEYIHKLNLKNQALASSSNNKRRWKDPVSGKELNHFVNTSKTNTNQLASTYVISKFAVSADVAATVLMSEYNSEIGGNIARMFEAEYLAVNDRLEIIGQSPGFDLDRR